MKQFNNNNAFTLTELLVICGIILILSAIILADYRVGERSFALQRSAHKLAQDLRVAQELSMSAKAFDCVAELGAGWKMKGYGINLTTGNDYYFLKARCESTTTPGSYDDRQVGEQIKLEKGVKIKTLTQNPLNIFFYPPEPEIDLGGLNTAEITLSLKTDEAKTKKIIINKTGLIEVQ